MKKILILGCEGQLGKELVKLFCNYYKKDYLIIACNRKEMDITNFIDLQSKIREEKPNLIINCAAYTDVDSCEIKREDAFLVNAIGPYNLAIIANAQNIKLCHISTDYVFDGYSQNEYCEYDLCNPKSVYGKTKLQGENFIMQYCKQNYIIRTSWLYSIYGNNFLTKIIKNTKNKKSIKVVNDQFGSPTSVTELVKVIARIIKTDNYGIYHCTGNGKCSWYDFACEIVRLLSIQCEIQSCNSEEFNSLAPRPLNSYLDNLRLRATIGDDMQNWKIALREFIRENRTHLEVLL